MIISKINEIKKINLTGLPIANLYMYEIDSNEKINLPNNFKSYENAIKNIVSSVNIKEGKFYVTIDTKVVKSGRTHRRPGKHVDGNYIFAWGGGGGWLVGKDGKYLNEKQFQYFAVDNYLEEYNLIIEVMGTYWHCDNRFYPTVNYEMQKK
jgi:hypothetical protein